MTRTGTTIPLALLCTWVHLAGCGASGQSATQSAAGREPQQSTAADDELISKVYDAAYAVPAGFYVDERADTLQSYAVYHVKDQSLSYELCTDEYGEAQTWEAADNASRAVNGHFVDSYQNDRYFEFIRELSYPHDVGNVPGETSLGFARIFKCSSVNRNGVDRNLRYGFGGTLNGQPLTAASVRNLTEYLWQFEYFDAAAKKVLDSTTTESKLSIDHTLRLAFLIKRGFDRCDRIEVYDWVFSADKSSGHISRAFRFQFAIEARRDNGIAVQCIP